MENKVNKDKMLAIVGSPRTNGNTNKVINQIEQRLADKQSTLEFEYVQLSKIKLETCKVCYVCIEKGERYCPLKDDRENLEHKMKQADAVIFASIGHLSAQLPHCEQSLLFK